MDTVNSFFLLPSSVDLRHSHLINTHPTKESHGFVREQVITRDVRVITITASVAPIIQTTKILQTRTPQVRDSSGTARTSAHNRQWHCRGDGCHLVPQTVVILVPFECVVAREGKKLCMLGVGLLAISERQQPFPDGVPLALLTMDASAIQVVRLVTVTERSQSRFGSF